MRYKSAEQSCSDGAEGKLAHIKKLRSVLRDGVSSYGWKGH